MTGVSTTFTDKTTVIATDWLNDINNVIYALLSDGTNPPANRAVILTNLLTAQIAGEKGDLLVANANGVYGNLAPGTDAQVLIADSTQTRGVKWGSPFYNWTSFSSVVPVPDSGSLGSIVANAAQYQYNPISKTLSVVLDYSFAVTGGTPATITFTVPSLSVAYSMNTIPAGIVTGGSREIGFCGISQSANQLTITFARITGTFNGNAGVCVNLIFPTQ